MTTGNNQENPYGDYVPGQYSKDTTTPEASPASGATDSYGNQTYTSGQPTYQQPTPETTQYGQPSYGQGSYSQTDYSTSYGSGSSTTYPSYGSGDVYGGYAGYGTVAKPKGLAVASLILGILAFLSGWAVLGGIFGIVGLILGIMGIKKANRGEADGKGLAIAGIVTSALGLIGALVAAVFWGWAASIAFECADQPTDYAMEQCINEKTGLTTYDTTSIDS
ncbi:DUF4190 domain-containing protein [Rothia nasimurium]|uniref:DUF4190 domain-containing protein n=1 Tax=Rothia nasimurium TaxID=85336 RepID=UPI003B9F8D06